MKHTPSLLKIALLALLVLLPACKPPPPDTIMKTLVLPTRTPLPTATENPLATRSPFKATALAATATAIIEDTATAAAIPPTLPPTETAAPQPMPMTREVAFAFDAGHGLVMAFGGLMANAIDVSDQTWAWDGTRWEQLHPQHSPAPRSGAGMVYDSSRQQMVLFGGGNTQGQQFNDTWTWDGQDWTEQHPKTSPSPRVDPKMAYDPIRDQVVLFAGAYYPPDGGQANFYHQTWTWDGQNWAEHNSGAISNGQIPQPGLAYDSARQQVILWQFGSGLWALDSKGWKNLPLGSPAPDIFLESAIGYDEIRQQVVLWGVNSLVNPSLNETWTWNDKAWTKVETDSGPGADGLEPHLFFNPQHRQLLLLAATGDKFSGFAYHIWGWNGKGWDRLDRN